MHVKENDFFPFSMYHGKDHGTLKFAKPLFILLLAASPLIISGFAAIGCFRPVMVSIL